MMMIMIVFSLEEKHYSKVYYGPKLAFPNQMSDLNKVCKLSCLKPPSSRHVILRNWEQFKNLLQSDESV